MKIWIPVVIILASAILGIIVKMKIKNKPKTEFLIWSLLMTFWLGFFIYGLILTLNQDYLWFSKDNMSNEISVLASILFLISGLLYYRRNKDYLLGKESKK